MIIYLIIIVLLKLKVCDAAVACSNTTICEELLRPGSECVEGFCTNPFHSGCLRTFLGDKNYYKERICNSHDNSKGNDNGEKDYCTSPLFDYQEIRIASQNWESAIFTSWIIQILLSELLEVPASIESSGPGRNANFYDLHNSFDYGAIGYDYDALKTAAEVSDCTQVVRANNEQDVEGYRSCAHIIPEVWSGQRAEYLKAEAEGVIEHPIGNGAVGKLGWYVPRFLGKKDPSLLSHFGVQGERNRRKVAETFKRPTNWKDYCELVSATNCTKNDGIAARAPQTEEEETRYHVDGLYLGHFRATEQNDCNKYPQNCTGHIVDLPCEWATYATQQAYHLDIPVESNGPLQPNGGYTYSNLIDIYAAANATRSAVLIYWWLPDPMYQQYLGTESEFTMVQLPPASQECVTARVTVQQRCSENFQERVGNQDGSCDGEAHSLSKLCVSNLYENLHDGPDVIHSPAYSAIKGFTISELQLGQILDYWSKRQIDQWNYDPREATCQWVVENLSSLEKLIPDSYPRTIHEASQYDHSYFTAVFVFDVSVTIFVVVVGILTFCYRKSPIIAYSQVGFLYLLLVGLFFVTIGSILLTIQPSSHSCGAREWFITLGYTLEILPLLVKISAVNTMMQAAKKFKRLKMKQINLYYKVAAVIVAVLFYLIVWTVLDPPTLQSSMGLTDEKTDDVEDWRKHTIVKQISYCKSNSDGWQYVNFTWRSLLLLWATLLAFQTRNIRSDFNESRTMTFLIYSHFLFLSLQVIIIFLTDSFQQDTLEVFRSVVYSADVVVAINIYFVSKLYKAFRGIDVIEQANLLKSKIMSQVVSNRYATHSVQPSEGCDSQRFGSNGESLSCISGITDKSNNHGTAELKNKLRSNLMNFASFTSTTPQNKLSSLPSACNVDPNGSAKIENGDDESDGVGFAHGSTQSLTTASLAAAEASAEVGLLDKSSPINSTIPSQLRNILGSDEFNLTGGFTDESEFEPESLSKINKLSTVEETSYFENSDSIIESSGQSWYCKKREVTEKEGNEDNKSGQEIHQNDNGRNATEWPKYDGSKFPKHLFLPVGSKEERDRQEEHKEAQLSHELKNAQENSNVASEDEELSRSETTEGFAEQHQLRQEQRRQWKEQLQQRRQKQQRGRPTPMPGTLYTKQKLHGSMSSFCHSSVSSLGSFSSINHESCNALE